MRYLPQVNSIRTIEENKDIVDYISNIPSTIPNIDIGTIEDIDPFELSIDELEKNNQQLNNYFMSINNEYDYIKNIISNKSYIEFYSSLINRSQNPIDENILDECLLNVQQVESVSFLKNKLPSTQRR